MSKTVARILSNLAKNRFYEKKLIEIDLSVSRQKPRIDRHTDRKADHWANIAGKLLISLFLRRSLQI